jgi:hypothetical protein
MKIVNDVMQRLEGWYAGECDGDWEHTARIEISTIDNPGWSVSVNVQDTLLEHTAFEEVRLERAEDDWIVCRKEGTRYVAWGGPRNLGELIDTFLRWADGAGGGRIG